MSNSVNFFFIHPVSLIYQLYISHDTYMYNSVQDSAGQLYKKREEGGLRLEDLHTPCIFDINCTLSMIHMYSFVQDSAGPLCKKRKKGV